MASRAPAQSAPAPAESLAAPTPSRHRESPRVRFSLKISSPGDSAEREAEATARRVVAMPAPVRLGPVAARMPLMPARAPAIAVPRPQAPAGAKAPPAKAAPPEETGPELEAAIRKELGGGRPLPPDVAAFMAPRFKANFGGVRIHTDAKAANLATRLGASAFTYGRDIFFNGGAFNPATPAGMELIAHELTHTIQQREVVQREVAPAAPVEVRETSAPKVQRGIISKALNWIADKANYIPGFRLFTIIIGVNPINMSPVERSGANILRALVEFLPGGGLIVEALDGYGIFEKAGGWIEQQFRTLGMVGGAFRDALMAFLDTLGPSDIFSPGDVIDRAIKIFTTPVVKLIDFGKGLVTGILKFIREAILKPLAALAEGKPGYSLLKVVLGEDPVTGEAVSPTPDMVIGGFMELIGQQEIWENIKKANAIPRAWSWFKTAMSGLVSLVKSIPKRFIDTLKSLEIMDLVLPYKAFIKVGTAFASFFGDFMSWGLGTVLELLQIIFEVVAPAAVPYIKKAAGAFNKIIKNPIGFVQTLVAAGKLGFNQFKGRFLAHLQAALVGWLTGTMAGAGVYIPKGFSLVEILKFVLSVLGLTWANIRAKLVKATSETAVKALETGFEIIKTLVTEGPAAAWKQILEGLTNLKEMVIEQIKEYVKSKVVEIAVTKLLSMLSPAGAFIQAIIAIYNTIMFFIERIRQIAAVAASFIDSISAIANGTIAPAANRVESTMAGMLTLVISFLARFAGLGKVSDAVLKLIAKVRAPIDKALDRVVAWIVAQAKKLGKLIVGAVSGTDKRTPEEKQRDLDKAARELKPKVRALFTKGPPGPLLRVRTMIWKQQYKLTDLVVEKSGAIRATINPTALIDQLVPATSQAALNVIRLEVQAYFHRDRDTSLAADVRRTGAGTRADPFIPGLVGNPVQGVRTMLVTGAARGESAFAIGTHAGEPIVSIIQRPNTPRSPNSGEGFILNPTTQTRVTIGPYERSKEIPGMVTVPAPPPATSAATVVTQPFGGDTSLPAGHSLELQREGRVTTAHSGQAAAAAAGQTTVNIMEGVRNPLGVVTIPSMLDRTAAQGDTGLTRLGVTQGGPQAPTGSAKDYRLAEHAMSRFDPATGAPLPASDPRIVRDPTPRGVKDPTKGGSEVRAAAQMNATIESLSNTILQGMVVDGVVMITSPSDFTLIKLRTQEYLLQNYGKNP